LKEPPRCVRGRSRRLVPTGKSHNRHVKPESVHDGISTASERTSLTYTASYAVNSTRTEFSMLYDFLALLLDFYRLDLHRNPPRPSIWPNQRPLICRNLDHYTSSRASGVRARGDFCTVTYTSPTLLIPTTTRSFLRQNSTRVCASVTGSSLT
jgi:hypothetical protein